MRFLYSIAWWLAMPFVLIKLWRRGRGEPGYRQNIAERFGFYKQLETGQRQPLLWVHAVSVGETRAAQPLIDALLAAYPDHALLLTHMTATGRATGQELFSHYGVRFVQSYLPYDTGWMAARFLGYFKPRIGILMETEVWPNMVAQCVRCRVPVALVNARLSERSLRRGKRFESLMLEAAAGLRLVAAQTGADADRLKRFGAANVHVTGSLKFEVAPPPAMLQRGAQLRARFGDRPVLLCASTREGEEALILSSLAAAAASGVLGDLLTVIVPRHPQRFDAVADMIAAYRGLPMQRRSALSDNGADALPASVRVLLGDSMGEMFAYYSVCDIAFIGGSLLPLGGQNLIEAATVGKPVLIGLHTFNFAQSTEDAIVAGGALRVPDAAQMLQQALALSHDREKRHAMGLAAQGFARQHQGATERTVGLLKNLL
ncbi:3-deoxy-D-manno-octulosonic acid transferase [Oxalobacteraceae bacterium CAVE-383]|nr:3-deoxy-D-manno-octulosonic acid transferase [Oxalobacteraceae bacterium CAVE-383]